MKLAQFPAPWPQYLIPQDRPGLNYHCLACDQFHPPQGLYYTCPACGGLLLLEDAQADSLAAHSGQFWRDLFDYRRMLNCQPLRGIFTFHEFLAPLIPVEDIVWLGEGHTPLVAAPSQFSEIIGTPTFIKHDGQNPSASFKDRGMAAALSYLRYLIRTQNLSEVLAVCASTGDTSAAAALYASAVGGAVKSAVLLPKGKVTPAQLGQPLAAGARVIELPGVFDDCMKVVEYLSENYQVALLNSKNPWRILGQESYAYEVAQQFDWDLAGVALFVPVGNAGNVTAIMSGLLKLHRYGVIETLPKVVAVQSNHADPVYRYYQAPPDKRHYEPVTVQPSVAQAAMIGDPVSFPRVKKIVEAYNLAAKEERFGVVQVCEQDIMENMLLANRNGLTVCTQGGEGLAGLRAALACGLVSPGEKVVVDSTAHALKFADFIQGYFDDNLREGYGVESRPEMVNRPQDISPSGVKLPGQFENSDEKAAYVAAAAQDVAKALGLKGK